MIDDATPVAAITSAEPALDRLDGCGVPVLDVDDPAVDGYPCTCAAGACCR